jgi:hypothetical protein
MNDTTFYRRLAEASPRNRGKVAGGLWLTSFAIAATTETTLRGAPNVVGGLLAVTGMVIMTLLIYGLFQPVSKALSLLAMCCNLIGLAFEAVRWQPFDLNVAIIFSGLYCVLLGLLILRSTFVPRYLGLFMVAAGLGWLTYLSTPFANYLSPYNMAFGVLGEVSVMLWLLIIGINTQKWSEQAAAQRASRC